MFASSALVDRLLVVVWWYYAGGWVVRKSLLSFWWFRNSTKTLASACWKVNDCIVNLFWWSKMAFISWLSLRMVCCCVFDVLGGQAICFISWRPFGNETYQMCCRRIYVHVIQFILQLVEFMSPRRFGTSNLSRMSDRHWCKIHFIFLPAE